MVSRDDVVRMAREAGIITNSPYLMPHDHVLHGIERFAALVAKHTLANIDPSSFMSWQEGYAAGTAAERESCAQVCEGRNRDGDWFAAEIRARSQS